MYPRCGSTFCMVSPFRVITRCSTPCVAGCCGPTLITSSPWSMPPFRLLLLMICVSVYIIKVLSCSQGLQNPCAMDNLQNHPSVSACADRDDAGNGRQTVHILPFRGILPSARCPKRFQP